MSDRVTRAPRTGAPERLRRRRSRATSGPDRSSSPPPPPGQWPPGRPAPPGGRSVGCGSVRRAPPVFWPEAGRGELHFEIDVGRLRRRLGGLPVLGLTAGTARAARPSVDLALRPAGFLPGSLAAGAPLPRLPAVPLAGFSLDRVRSACHVIVAPLAARVAAEPGLADWWGRSRRVACELSPPARLRSWSRSRFRPRTARRPHSSRCPGARSPACRSCSPASEGAPCDS